jgi:hypothetical protein
VVKSAQLDWTLSKLAGEAGGGPRATIILGPRPGNVPVLC